MTEEEKDEKIYELTEKVTNEFMRRECSRIVELGGSFFYNARI